MPHKTSNDDSNSCPYLVTHKKTVPKKLQTPRTRGLKNLTLYYHKMLDPCDAWPGTYILNCRTLATWNNNNNILKLSKTLLAKNVVFSFFALMKLIEKGKDDTSNILLKKERKETYKEMVY